MTADLCTSEGFAEKVTACCPVCGGAGQRVPVVTVRSLVREDLAAPEGEYAICLAPGCPVVYFGPALFRKGDLTVRVWFKEKDEPKPICYCKNVTEAEILAHIRAGCCHTLEDIQRHTGADTGKQCAVKNPTGR
ncbi:MAG: (2Fe-2S)-binding protein [Thermoanaerobacterales bacterium]|nr:(2Fe-2S)-binding protein [Thermoanaerobacterales bacterium]